MSIEDKIRTKCESFKSLDFDDCASIILSAKALTLDECFDHCLIDKSTLSAEEASYCQMLHRHGRAIGINDACNKLFVHMSTKNGGQSALEYLKQFSQDFSVEVQGQSGGGFQFNVVIPEPGQKAEAKVSTGK